MSTSDGDRQRLLGVVLEHRHLLAHAVVVDLEILLRRACPPAPRPCSSPWPGCAPGCTSTRMTGGSCRGSSQARPSSAAASLISLGHAAHRGPTLLPPTPRHRRNIPSSRSAPAASAGRCLRAPPRRPPCGAARSRRCATLVSPISMRPSRCTIAMRPMAKPAGHLAPDLAPSSGSPSARSIRIPDTASARPLVLLRTTPSKVTTAPSSPRSTRSAMRRASMAHARQREEVAVCSRISLEVVARAAAHRRQEGHLVAVRQRRLRQRRTPGCAPSRCSPPSVRRRGKRAA